MSVIPIVPSPPSDQLLVSHEMASAVSGRSTTAAPDRAKLADDVVTAIVSVPMRHLHAIDGLRAIAVLAVVAYHAGLPVPAGFVGVDVFFVISGYLITRLLADEVRGTGRVDFLHFYARRARRILPAAVLVVVVTLALSMLLPSGRGEVAESAAAAGVFGANFYFQAATGGYWSASAETMPLLHLWSLSVEEQFYLLWPLLLLAVRRAPLHWLVVVAVASFVLAEALMVTHPQAAFYQMPARAWELAAGGIVAVRSFRVPRLAAPVGLVLTLAACFLPLPHFPGVGALPAVAGAALLIAAIHSGQSVRVLELRPVVYVGLVSYSLYLWHWPLLVLDRALRVGDAPLAVRLALCGGAFVLAAMSYRYVETPFRNLHTHPRKVVVAGLVCVALVGCIGLAGAMSAPPKQTAPVVTYKRCPQFNPDAPSPTNPACNVVGPRIVVMGDSMANAWQPIALAVSGERRMPLVTMSRDGCPPATGTLALRDPGEGRRCRVLNDQRLAYVAAHRPEVVVLVSRWGWLQKHNPGFDEGVVSMIAAMSPLAKQILVIGPSPEMPASPQKCEALGVACVVPWDDYLAQSAEARRLMDRVAAIQNVRVLDVASWLCGQGKCPGARDGNALYSDTFHVSRSAAARYALEHRSVLR